MNLELYLSSWGAICLPVLLLLGALCSQTQAQTPVVTTFSYTGKIETFIVPTSVMSLTIEVRGAEGATHSTTQARVLSLEVPLPSRLVSN